MGVDCDPQRSGGGPPAETVLRSVAPGRGSVRGKLNLDERPERERLTVPKAELCGQAGRERQDGKPPGDEPAGQLDLTQAGTRAQRLQLPIDLHHDRRRRQVHDEAVRILQDPRLVDALSVLARHRDRSVESAHAPEPTR